MQLYLDRTPLDREERSQYDLVLRAYEKENLYSVANLTIRVLDDNDNAPAMSFFPIVVNDSGIVVKNEIDRYKTPSASLILYMMRISFLWQIIYDFFV